MMFGGKIAQYSIPVQEEKSYFYIDMMWWMLSWDRIVVLIDSGIKVWKFKIHLIFVFILNAKWWRGNFSEFSSENTDVWWCFDHLFPAWWRHDMETMHTLLAFCEGNHRVPHKGLVTRVLMFYMIFVWTNYWPSNLIAGNLRRHDGNLSHCDGKLPLWNHPPWRTFSQSNAVNSLKCRI